MAHVITPAAYHAGQARTLQMFSGHWLLFDGAPALYFLRRRDDEDSAAS